MSRRRGWFSLLLRLLPRHLRESYGEEMAALASDYARGQSRFAKAATWLRAGLDVVWVAFSARMPWGRRSGAPKARRGGREGIIGDLGYGLRSIRRDLRLAVFVAAIVGLGVGACVTVFSVAHALLFRPLPFREPDRLVWISNGDFGPGQRLSEISVQVAYVVALRDRATEFVDVAGYHLFDGDGDHTITRGGEPWRATRLRVTGNFFDVLGVQPVFGRLFTAEEAWDDGPRTILLTWGCFTRRFAQDRSIIGRTVDVDGAPATVIGVLPRSFDFSSIFAPGHRIDYVAPFPLSARSNRTGNTLGLVGRLAPGATPQAAAKEASAISARVEADRLNGFDPVVRPLREHVSGPLRTALAVLSGAVLLVLLMVCANLAHLLLARGANREREMAIRAAIGAPRARLVRQMLIESTILSGAGCLVGIGVAYLSTGFLSGLGLDIPLLDQARVDGAAMAAGIIVALAVGLITGVLPALRHTGMGLHESLKDSARGSSAGRAHGALRGGLIVAEMALACTLLITSTLFVRSLVEILDVDLGYHAQRTVAIRIDPSVRFRSNEARVGYYADVLNRVSTLPNVDAVGLSDVLPMAFNRRWSARRADAPRPDQVYPFVRMVSEGYVGAMGLTLVAGRDLSPEDGPGAPRVALVNERMAGLLWPGASALGERFLTSGRDYTVVGVVRDTRQVSVELAPGPEMFFSVRQNGDQAAVFLLLRGVGPLDGLVAATRAQLHAVDAALPLDQVMDVRDLISASVAPQRFLTGLLATFALLALVLAALGIYGVVSYAVTQRRREIGIHIAVGASAGDVQGRILRETMTFSAAGLGLGVASAVAGSRLLSGLLFGVTALDPLTYVAVAALLGVTAAVAGLLPARRAARANPLSVLDGHVPG